MRIEVRTDLPKQADSSSVNWENVLYRARRYPRRWASPVTQFKSAESARSVRNHVKRQYSPLYYPFKLDVEVRNDRVYVRLTL